MVRFYVLPIIGVGTKDDPRRPAYFSDPLNGLSEWTMMDYGLESTGIVQCDVTAGQHTALVANADVLGIPANLDGTFSEPTTTTVKTTLELLNIPADWITDGMTFRVAVRLLRRLFLVAQRYHGMTGKKLFELGDTLDTVVSSAKGQELIDAAASLGIPAPALGLSIRDMLKDFANQLTIKVGV